MTVVRSTAVQPMTEDPDDYRPSSAWRLIADRGGESGSVSDISVIVEHIAPGDRVPLHVHQDVNECILVLQGHNEVTIGTEKLQLSTGDAVFVARGTAHSQRNVGDEPLVIHAVFPSTVVDIQMLERNPAPGTEAEPPRHTVYDMRTGEFWERS